MREGAYGRLNPTGTATSADPPVAIAAGVNELVVGVVTGAILAQNPNVIATPRTALDAGLVQGYARVSANNAVTIALHNTTAAPVTPAAAITWDIQVQPRNE